jgi:putative FmdB family regulatory protein
VPTYEYRCDACGATYEVFQKMSDPPLEVCEACGGSLRKVLHPVAIHFKGSGFYTTDYGRAGSGRRAGKAEGETEAAGGDAKKTSEKPAGDGADGGPKKPADGGRSKEKQPAG